MTVWNDTQPIFVQIRERLINLILSGAVKEADALPSVRQISTDLSVNPLTVTKAYQSLLDLGVIEKRRGLGMFLLPNARDELMAYERETFLNNEWPRIYRQINSLELDLADLMKAKKGNQANAKRK